MGGGEGRGARLGVGTPSEARGSKGPYSENFENSSGLKTFF